MQMERHDTASCPHCGSVLWFGVKEEGSGWSVYYECDECWFEEMVGYVSRSELGDSDDVREHAKEIWRGI